MDKLPTEIVGMIVRKLESRDFLNFRLANRSLRARSFQDFTMRFFETRRHILSRHSLETLRNVATHPAFGSALRVLVIHPDHLTARHLANFRDKEAAAVDKISYEQHLAEQDHLAASGYDTACLAQGLSKATNCRTIFIEDDIDHRPWGARSLEKLTGVEPNSTLDSLESRKFFARAIHVIFAAVAAGCVPLERFELYVGLSRVPVDPGMLQLPDFCLTMSPITSTLTTLRFTVGPPERGSALPWARHLVRFIVQFSRLEVLRLGFASRIQVGDLKALSEGICLKNLRVLEIDTVSGTEDHLARLLLAHKMTLRDVYLELTELPTLESWKSLLTTVRDELCLDRLEITDCEASDRIVMFGDKQLSDSISIQGGKEVLDNLIGTLTLGKMI